MAFTVGDFDDLVRLLSEHPEWQERLRSVIFRQDMLELPSRVSGIESRLDRIEGFLERMAGRQEEFDRRMVGFAERQEAVERRLETVESQLQQLVEQIGLLTDAVASHNQRMNRMDGRMGNIEGQLLEIRYHNRARNWLSRYVRKAEVVSIDDLELLESAVTDGTLAPSEVDRLRDVDMLVRGRADDGDVLLLAIEVSQTINREDVDRANEHALVLRRAGYSARPLVGG